MSPRNKVIDIVKGIGIIFIVIWHIDGVVGSETNFLLSVRYFVNQFHVPLFFFISGLFFKSNETWAIFLLKKLRRLYIPFVISNILFLIAEFLLRIQFEDVVIGNFLKWGVKIICGLSWTNLGGATWFLLALFRICIIYKLMSYIKSQFGILCISVIISIISIWAPVDFCIRNTLYYIVFYSIGAYVTSCGFKFNGKSLAVWLIMIISFIVLAFTSRNNLSSTISNTLLINVLKSLIAIVGIAFMMSSCALLEKIVNIGTFFAYVGRNTMSILIGHFAVFKVVTIIQVLSAGVSYSFFMSHPCYDVSFPWSFVYFVLGVSVPLVVSHFIDLAKSINHTKCVEISGKIK